MFIVSSGRVEKKKLGKQGSKIRRSKKGIGGKRSKFHKKGKEKKKKKTRGIGKGVKISVWTERKIAKEGGGEVVHERLHIISISFIILPLFYCWVYRSWVWRGNSWPESWQKAPVCCSTKGANPSSLYIHVSTPSSILVSETCDFCYFPLTWWIKVYFDF